MNYATSLHHVYEANNNPLSYPDLAECDRIVQAIIQQLDGLPLSQALEIVTERVPSVLASTHTVDVSHDRYQQVLRT